ncbi:hypothetical protein OG884_09355 [Streptosporangium sp. NBC_01755]|uniref:hypothetical protein n=1 Tax=Streptosporangium sp. NBC_01755 TaxID=2975949 RepID=UPI002DD8B419|nr:hypothetical protein [Streptosporangium sp. NBC_01755]WSD02099.1 hypothetical protein OG884_09355 [Streptosporangium sp. NBC_01755]
MKRDIVAVPPESGGVPAPLSQATVSTVAASVALDFTSTDRKFRLSRLENHSARSGVSFLAFNTLGAALWVPVPTVLGYTVGTYIGEVYDEIARYFGYLLIGLVVLALTLLVRHLLRHRREHD